MNRLLATLALVLSFASPVLAGSFESGDIAVVNDDGNNLRTHGGAGYQEAKVPGLLNRGAYVRVLQQQGNWSEVLWGDEQRGWVNSKCLVPVSQYLADPVNKEDVYCPKDYRRRFVVDLDKAHPKALIVLEDVPTLFGGGSGSWCRAFRASFSGEGRSRTCFMTLPHGIHSFTTARTEECAGPPWLETWTETASQKYWPEMPNRTSRSVPSPSHAGTGGGLPLSGAAFVRWITPLQSS